MNRSLLLVAGLVLLGLTACEKDLAVGPDQAGVLWVITPAPTNSPVPTRTPDPSDVGVINPPLTATPISTVIPA